VAAYRPAKGVGVPEPDKELIRVVQRSALPAVLLRVPSEEILAVSEETARLLGRSPKDLVGHHAQEFSADPPHGVFTLLAQGRVHGFQSSRTLVRGDGSKQPLHVWVRGVEHGAPVGFAVAVLWPGGRQPWMYLPDLGEGTATHEIIGTADAHLLVERISDDVRLLCLTPEEVVGSSIFKLFDITSAADVLQALADATQNGRGLGLMVNVCRDDKPAMAELMLRPLSPAPSFSFCLTLREGADAEEATVADPRNLDRAGRGLHALALAETVAALSAAGVKGVDKLSTRETDIICRLRNGDRVPAIARSLYLSQSTVRNHLSSAFRKVGVSSQQELIDLLREATERLRGQDISSS